MMGIPESDSDQVFAWTNIILGAGDPEYGGTYENLMNVSLEIFAYAQAMGEDRRANPRDDLTSVLMAAEIDGDRLTPQEFGSFFILLVVAGNETTRNAISHGMQALTEHPDQRELWYDDFDGAHQDGGRGDRPLGVAGDPLPPHRDGRHRAVRPEDRGRREGRPVVQLGQPRRADVPGPVSVRRPPPDARRQQVGFGAGGPHFCLGANLARREITVMFDELRRRVPDLRITGEPAYLESPFINGIKRLPCAWG